MHIMVCAARHSNRVRFDGIIIDQADMSYDYLKILNALATRGERQNKIINTEEEEGILRTRKVRRLILIYGHSFKGCSNVCVY